MNFREIPVTLEMRQRIAEPPPNSKVAEERKYMRERPTAVPRNVRILPEGISIQWEDGHLRF